MVYWEMRLLKKLIDKNSSRQEKREELVTGVDIVSVDRIKKILLRNREGFYKKIFTGKEIDYIEEKNHKPTTVSGLFAAKEAVSKAAGIGIGNLGWKDIEVLHEVGGRPFINFTEKGKGIMKELGIGDMQISISHERDYAIAFVKAYRSSI